MRTCSLGICDCCLPACSNDTASYSYPQEFKQNKSISTILSNFVHEKSLYSQQRYLNASVEQKMLMERRDSESFVVPLPHPISNQRKGTDGCTLNPVIPDYATQTALDMDYFRL